MAFFPLFQLRPDRVAVFYFLPLLTSIQLIQAFGLAQQHPMVAYLSTNEDHRWTGRKNTDSAQRTKPDVIF